MCIVFLAKIRDLELAVTTLLKKNFEIILSAPFPGKFKKKKKEEKRERKNLKIHFAHWIFHQQ